MSPEAILFALRVLLALVLYSFLGAIILFLWRDLQEAGPDALQVPQAHLTVLGPEGVLGTFRLEPTTDIGRAAGNVVRLEDETVSAHHARISFHGGQWWLEDLASRNGTTLNELPVNEPLVVAYGDEIHFGRVRARIEAGAPEQDQESSASVDDDRADHD